jgi:long-chain fatty acid transport protein
MGKRFTTICFGLALALTARVGLATNGHQLSAIGAYGEGMAGAVTAAPYDASTAITNPAGMALIGSRTDFSFEGFFPKRAVSYALGGGETKSGSPYYIVPAMGWTAQTNESGNVYFGGGMYGVSGMGVDYDSVSAPLMETASGGPFDPGSARAHVFSQYQFWKMAPTLAWKRGPVAFGFAVNLDYQSFGFKNLFTGTVSGAPAKFGMDLSEVQGAVGYGAALGIIYQASPVFAVGASYTSKQFFTDFKWRLGAGDVSLGPIASRDGTYTMKLDFPQQAAFGIAVRPFRPVLWTADAKWINYHDTYNKVKLRGDFTGGADTVVLDFGWDNVTVLATALQIDVTPKTAFRLGFNYSSSPIKAEDVDNNVAFPAIARRRAAGGFTYRPGRNWELTVAYLKTFKEELTSNSGSGTSISLEESATDIELSYRF